MKKILISLLFAFAACGQSTDKIQKVNIDQVDNQTIKKALDALQNSDGNAWFSLFTENAELYDDGHKKNFRNFLQKQLVTNVLLQLIK